MIPKRFLTIFAVAAGLALIAGGGCGDSDDDPNQPVACSIGLVQPEGGEEFIVPPLNENDELVTLEWDAAGGGEVSVELLKGGDLQGEIIDATENDGFFFWRIDTPEDLALLDGTGNDYAVRVTSTGDTSCGDTSEDFRIWDRNGCEVLVGIEYPGQSDRPPSNPEAGDVMTITWSPTNASGSFSLDLWVAFPTSGSPDFLLAPLAFNVRDTSYAWTMDSFNYRESARYVIQVSDDADAECDGWSPSFVLEDPDICSIMVHRPNNSDTPLIEGETFLIIWDSDGASEHLDIELKAIDDGELVFVDNIVDPVDAYLGSYEWVVDDYDYDWGDASNRAYVVFIYDKSDRYCVDRSDPFEILEP